MMLKLPIEVANATPGRPVQFRWNYLIDGKKMQRCEGTLPGSVEKAVTCLIEIVEKQRKEIRGLKASLRAATELLEKRMDNADQLRGDAADAGAGDQGAQGRAGRSRSGRRADKH